jgi:Kdo2-lipid IVA lauroyltransferase/acyltransferase
MAISKAAVNWVIKPLSRLPYGLLYFLSDILYYFIRYVTGYRKKVVQDNMRKCFPEKTETELKKTMNEFYRHFCDLVVETLKVGE